MNFIKSFKRNLYGMRLCFKQQTVKQSMSKVGTQNENIILYLCLRTGCTFYLAVSVDSKLSRKCIPRNVSVKNTDRLQRFNFVRNSAPPHLGNSHSYSFDSHLFCVSLFRRTLRTIFIHPVSFRLTTKPTQHNLTSAP